MAVGMRRDENVLPWSHAPPPIAGSDWRPVGRQYAPRHRAGRVAEQNLVVIGDQIGQLSAETQAGRDVGEDRPVELAGQLVRRRPVPVAYQFGR